MADQHMELCLAENGGPGVWPCGCHAEIVDSYGMRKLLSVDGATEPHEPCEHHVELWTALREARAREAQLQAKCEFERGKRLENLRDATRAIERAEAAERERDTLRAQLQELKAKT